MTTTTTATTTATTVKLSDYIVTPVDIWRLGKALGWRRILAASGVLAAGGGALAAGANSELVVPFVITLLAVVTRVDARAPFAVAIALLVIIAAWSAFDSSGGPEVLAVWAYYGLVLGVVLLVRDQIWPRRQAIIKTATAPLSKVAQPRRVLDLRQAVPAAHRHPSNHTLDLRPKS